MAFWGMLPAANVHPHMVVGILLRMFIAHRTSFHHDSTYVLLIYMLILFLRNIAICNIDVIFGRVRIIYFEMQPLVDSDRKGNIYLDRFSYIYA